MTHFFLLRLDNLAALYRAVGGRRLRVALALAGIDSVGDDLIAFGLLVGPGGDGTGQRQGGSGGSNEHILWFYQPPFGTCWFFDACVPGDVSAHRLNRRRICDTKRIEGFATRGRRITVSPRSVPRDRRRRLAVATALRWTPISGSPSTAPSCPASETALKAFQHSGGLVVEGIVGPLSWDALRDGGPMPTLDEGAGPARSTAAHPVRKSRPPRWVFRIGSHYGAMAVKLASRTSLGA